MDNTVLGLSPLPVTVTPRKIPFLVWNPAELSLFLLLAGGVDQREYLDLHSKNVGVQKI